MSEETLQHPETEQFESSLHNARLLAFEVLNQTKENDKYENWRVLHKPSMNSVAMRTSKDPERNIHLFLDNVEHSGVLIHLINTDLADQIGDADLIVLQQTFLLGPTHATSSLYEIKGYEYSRFSAGIRLPFHSVSKQLENVKQKGAPLDTGLLRCLNEGLEFVANETKQPLQRQHKSGRLIGMFIGSKHVTH